MNTSDQGNLADVLLMSVNLLATAELFVVIPSQ